MHTALPQLPCSWAQKDFGDQVLSAMLYAVYKIVSAWKLTFQGEGVWGLSNMLASFFFVARAETDKILRVALFLRST